MLIEVKLEDIFILNLEDLKCGDDHYESIFPIVCYSEKAGGFGYLGVAPR